jgi:uncharacterized protein YecT (DUF1311 family)
VRARLPAAGIALALAWAAAEPVAAQRAVGSKDRAALQACLDKARADGTRREDCIGIIEGPCLKQSDGDTTAGMKDCTGREIGAWDERLNRTYRDLLAGDLGPLETQRTDASGKTRKVTGADLIREAQRAWIAAREKKCDAAGLPMEGGTGSDLLSVGCFLKETAAQVLWLDDLKENR